jgi:hypothetical protein
MVVEAAAALEEATSVAVMEATPTLKEVTVVVVVICSDTDSDSEGGHRSWRQWSRRQRHWRR